MSHGPRGTRRSGALLVLALALGLGGSARAQVNSGSTGAGDDFIASRWGSVFSFADKIFRGAQ